MRPTGVPSFSGAGPAAPVIDTATSAGERANAPSAMARATASLTMPARSIRLLRTPSAAVLFSAV
jgi:hypothetical protein